MKATEWEELKVWLGNQPKTEILKLLDDMRLSVPAIMPFINRARLASVEELPPLEKFVTEAFKPNPGFFSEEGPYDPYDYDWHYDDFDPVYEYAESLEPDVEALIEAAEPPRIEMLAALEQAMALLESNARAADNWGDGDLIDELNSRLASAHQRVSSGLTEKLSTAERVRLGEWIADSLFGDPGLTVDIPVDKYADALGEVGMERFQELFRIRQGRISSTAKPADSRKMAYTQRRLAILSKDLITIVEAFGGEPKTVSSALELVKALDDAGLYSDALTYADLGIRLKSTIDIFGHDYERDRLADRILNDVENSGNIARNVEIRSILFEVEPSITYLQNWLDAAVSANSLTQSEQEEKERMLGRRNPVALLTWFLDEGRDEEAWSFHLSDPEKFSKSWEWERLLDMRAISHPEDVIPHYMEMIDNGLEVTNVHNYPPAAQRLLKLRDACDRCGRHQWFAEYLAATVERNRRRSRCMAEFRSVGLINR